MLSSRGGKNQKRAMLSKSGNRDGDEEEGTKSYRFPDRALHAQFELG